jgi:hypothetical protein
MIHHVRAIALSSRTWSPVRPPAGLASCLNGVSRGAGSLEAKTLPQCSGLEGVCHEISAKSQRCAHGVPVRASGWLRMVLILKGILYSPNYAP